MPEFEDLANAYLDGSLSAAERAQFEELLRTDPARVQQFRGLLALHGMLAARFGELPEPALTMERLHSEEVQQTSSSVLATIKGDVGAARPKKRIVKARTSTSWAIGVAASVAFAAVLTALYFLTRTPRPESGSRQTEIAKEAKPEFVAEIKEASANIATVLRGNETVALKTGDRLQAHDVLRTGGEGRVKLQLFGAEAAPEATSFEVGPNAELAIMPDSGAGKRVDIDRGTIECSVAPQPAGRPLTIYSPSGVAIIVGTRFVLAASEHATRLEVNEGSVKLSDTTRQPATVLVKSGYAAVARRHETVAAPVQIARPAPVVAVPSDIALVGFLSHETQERIKLGRQVVYHLTDRNSNRFIIASMPAEKNGVVIIQSKEGRTPAAAPQEPIRQIALEDFVGKLVSVKGRGILRKAQGEHKDNVRLENFQIQSIEAIGQLPKSDEFDSRQSPNDMPPLEK